MTAKRLIPVLLHKQGRLVLSRGFAQHQDIGDALQIADRYKNWDLDELIYLDITPHWCAYDRENSFLTFVETIRGISRNCFTPLSAGGGITSVDDMHALIEAGADRIVLNSNAVLTPPLITQGAHIFGAQAMIIGIDVRRTGKTFSVFINGGREETGLKLEDWMKQATDLGAGEFFVNSIDRDGQGTGYDEDLIAALGNSPIPVIVCGGAGSWQDMVTPLQSPIQAAAAANIFTFTELSYHAAKSHIRTHMDDIRPARVGIDYALARREREQGSRLGAEKTILWQELDKGGLME